MSPRPETGFGDLDAWWWCAPVALVPVDVPSPEGTCRYTRYAREGDRLRARAADSLLRRAVAWLLPGDLADPVVERCCARCGSAEHGRPSIRGSKVEVSISHSGSFVAVAVAHRRVGIDIEDTAGVAAGEWAFADWVRVESVLKATGDGLTVDPRTVRLVPDGGVWRVGSYNSGSLLAVTTDLAVQGGVAGAITVLSSDVVLRAGDLSTLL